MKKSIIFIIYILTFSSYAKAVLSDKDTYAYIQKGLDHTYNYEFGIAEKYFEKVKAKHPTSAVYYLLEAIKMNLEFPQLVADESELYKKFKQHIKTSILLADMQLKENQYDLENIFFKMTAMSLAGLKHSQAKQYTKAMNIAKSTYDYVKQAIKYKEQFHEFYFTSGLYNYYVVQYPESHPIIKPFMVFFQNGNKELGLKELLFATQNTAFSSPEAYGFLANIYFKYEFGLDKAYTYSLTLNHKYPKNSYFQYKLCEIAIMKKELKVSKTCLDSLKNNKSPFYQSTHLILTAYYQEQTHMATAKIKQGYLDGLSVLSKHQINSAELSSIAYTGLGRCYAKEQDHPKAKYYYKLVMDNSSNKYYEKEALEYLKSHWAPTKPYQAWPRVFTKTKAVSFLPTCIP